MKPNLHPVYKNITISCACSAAYETRSARLDSYAVDICSACHPFYTGKARVLDKEGRVEKFNTRYKRGGAGKKAS